MKNIFLLLSTSFILCLQLLTIDCTYSQKVPRPLDYVDPFIGTSRMGHTFPGACVPFGAIQLSPDTDTIPYSENNRYNKNVYNYCAGYQYADSTIVGFSHTHFSGTGHSDLGDILIMPTTGDLMLNPGTATHPQNGYRSTFKHKNEKASPGYYEVLLDKYNILVKLTTDKRTALHEYTFPKSDQAHIILDLEHGIYNYDDKTLWTFVRIENDSVITGYKQTNGWARTRTVYFAIKFSKPFQSYQCKDFEKKSVYRGFWGKFDQINNFPEQGGKKLHLGLNFQTKENEKILLKVALSPVSTQNALENMNVEIKGWNFNKTLQNAQNQWLEQLNKINPVFSKKSDSIVFYTSLYHCAIMPTLYMDSNNEYKGLDQNVHLAEQFNNYTSFSLWDTFRAFHPLLNIINPSINIDIIKSFMVHFKQSSLHLLPIWSHYANENWCMSGYHSVSVIADAYIKNENLKDAELALEQCVITAKSKYLPGMVDYLKYGYIPYNKNNVSVSTTLEYAYDDWCIAQFAKKLKKEDIYKEFMERSTFWKNVYDKSIGFMRPKGENGTFKSDFDAFKTDGQGFIEGNAWNFSLFVPHEPESMIQLMGGDKAFINRLDSLFEMHLPDHFFAETEDITRDGIIGNYVHGNEPSHHVPYLYNFTSQPWKGQAKIRHILDHQYKTGASGLGGNDDCGQMSAWYLFSSLGFYPIAPGSDKYWLGSPKVESASINLENGKLFKIIAKNQSEKNVYIKSVFLNDKPLKNRYITHSDIIAGGKIEFEMSNKPKKRL